ncbi:asparagine synthase (glutamine-hydrolyzing) [Candidatus Woesearchaeota archaeon]|nr:asparagine synthase (glutamine-hydrolyzing) [Candidatus Woesearchaeota archaeon]
MCGINGFNWKDEKLVSAMNTTIKHRGPDDSGKFISDTVTLGHVRLSILDLSEKGHQPMGINKDLLIYKDNKLETADYVVVYNGEIYNFEEINKRLNCKLESSCDTETLLRAYEKWGVDCVKEFNGMWAFCIYDKKKNILFCSRDRLGQKPFHYYYNKNNFAFSSELKGLLKIPQNFKTAVSKEALELYFTLGFIPSPLTIYENNFKLEAGHNLIFDLKKNTLKKITYYEPSKFKPEHNKKKLILEGRKIFSEATRLRMIADVPVGAFLSGGLDSSAVVGEMRKNTKAKNLNTFSIGFDKEYDETKYIDLVKRFYKTKHHHHYFKRKDFENLIETYSESYDEPFADYSGFPTLKVSEMARKHVTVALSGDGGDEIFGGYNMHKMGAQMDLLSKLPRFVRKIIAKLPIKENIGSMASFYLLKEAASLSLYPKEEFYAKALAKNKLKSKAFDEWTKRTLKESLTKTDGSYAEMLRYHDLMYNTLGDKFLVKVDRASMQYALEVRSPFLDYRFVEFAQKIPVKWKATVFKTKILMRDIIKDNVPKEILNRGKQGFTPPLDKWILDKKYEPVLKSGLKSLETIHPEIAKYYKEKVFKEYKKNTKQQEKNRIVINNKIKLFIFQKWLKQN